RLPFYELGLQDLLARGIQSGTLTVSGDLDNAAGPADVVFIAVGTPSMESGKSDLSALGEVVQKLTCISSNGQVIAIKSTVPMGTTDTIAATLALSGHDSVA